MKDTALLITGCISPIPNQPYLVLIDPKERYCQYIKSIQFYIKESSFSKIVYCDNSNFSYNADSELQELAQSCGKRFEWLAFQGNNVEVLERGKGYGEGELIQYALQHSDLIRESEIFAKVTGRLIIKNIKEISSLINKNRINQNYFNRDIYRAYGLDTRFYVVNKNYYITNLLDVYKSVGIAKRQGIEELFLQIMLRQDYRPLPVYPRFEGKSGGNGRDYGQESELKLFIYDIMCKVGIFNVFSGLYQESAFRLLYKLREGIQQK